MGDLVELHPGRAHLTRVEAGRILRAGATVGADPDATVLACPYLPTGTATERVKVQAWVRGAWLRIDALVTTPLRPVGSLCGGANGAH